MIRLKQGTITAAGLNGPPPTKHFAITGGTGLYRTAGGQTTLIEFGSTRGKLTIHLLGFLTRRMKPHARPGHPSRARTGPGSMPNAVGTAARQNCLFRAAPAAMSNDRDWRQIGGSGAQADCRWRSRSVTGLRNWCRDIGLSGQGMQGHAVVPGLENPALPGPSRRDCDKACPASGGAGEPQKVLALYGRLAAELPAGDRGVRVRV